MTKPPFSSEDERDLTMGRFIDTWSSLEDKLFLLFWKLAKTDYYIAKAIYSTGIHANNLIELLITIAPYRLKKVEQKTLISLCKRFDKFSRKLNKIIHSVWQLEHNRNKSQWVRISSPISYQTRIEIHNLKNPSIRRRYRFTIKQLAEVTQQIETLHKDFDALIIPFISRLAPYEEITISPKID